MTKKITERQMANALRAAGWKKVSGYILRELDYPTDDDTTFWFYAKNPLEKASVWIDPSGEMVEEDLKDAYDWHKDNE